VWGGVQVMAGTANTYGTRKESSSNVWSCFSFILGGWRCVRVGADQQQTTTVIFQTCCCQDACVEVWGRKRRRRGKKGCVCSGRGGAKKKREAQGKQSPGGDVGVRGMWVGYAGGQRCKRRAPATAPPRTFLGVPRARAGPLKALQSEGRERAAHNKALPRLPLFLVLATKGGGHAQQRFRFGMQRETARQGVEDRTTRAHTHTRGGQGAGGVQAMHTRLPCSGNHRRACMRVR
jgi:hypothetical protein